METLFPLNHPLAPALIWLDNNGFKARNLIGGYRNYKFTKT
jgi:hypothetical protein